MGRLAEAQRRLLEQLMGAEAMGTVTQNLDFRDPKVCKNFLCGTCPHDLFTNTRMDIGTCPKSHSDRLKTDYTAAVARGDTFPEFEREYESNIFNFIDECDRRIKAAQRRLEKTPEENARTTTLMREIGEIEMALQDAMKAVEDLGEQGQIEESLQELKKAEALKAEKADREKALQDLTESAGASGHQKLRVCDVCGAYLSVLDSDRRLADHFGGKLHLGYLRLREMIAEFLEKRRGKASGGFPPAAPAGPASRAPPTGPSSGSMGPPPPPTGPSSRGGGDGELERGEINGYSGVSSRRERDGGYGDRAHRDRDSLRDRDRERDGSGHGHGAHRDRDPYRERERERERGEIRPARDDYRGGRDHRTVRHDDRERRRSRSPNGVSSRSYRS